MPWLLIYPIEVRYETDRGVKAMLPGLLGIARYLETR